MAEHGDKARRVTFAEASRFWVWLGFVSFGGPAGQIAIMHRELVERRRWIGEERFLHALQYCTLLPGPEAQQLATYCGWLMHRLPGGLVAGIAFVLPSVFVLMALSFVYVRFGQVVWVSGVLAGFKPVVVAIVVEAVWRIGRRTLRTPVHAAIGLGSFVAVGVLHAPYPLVVVLAALAGAAAGDRAVGAGKSTNGRSVAVAGAAFIEDAAPPPPHTLPSRGRFLRTLAVGLCLWAVPLAGLVVWRGWGSLHVQAYRFFTQAAFVTFGGAYAVLGYVTRVATVDYGWLTPAQAVDGLALAETTPGPLIMVLQFIGFVAAWQQPQGLSPLVSAVVGGLLTTYATFLPSTLFIFLGAPYVEVLRGSTRLATALSGVTAAVVGVILHLAVVFGWAVFFTPGQVDVAAALMAVAAAVALTAFQLNVVWIIAAGGVVGLLRAVVL